MPYGDMVLEPTVAGASAALARMTPLTRIRQRTALGRWAGLTWAILRIRALSLAFLFGSCSVMPPKVLKV